LGPQFHGSIRVLGVSDRHDLVDDFEGAASLLRVIEFYAVATREEGDLSPGAQRIPAEIDGEQLGDTAVSAYRHFKAG